MVSTADWTSQKKESVKLEDESFEIIQSEDQKKKECKGMKKSYRT